MPDVFRITCPSITILLDANRTGKAYFTVINISDRAIHGRVSLKVEDSQVLKWLMLQEPAETDYLPGMATTYTVQIRLPVTQTPGTYSFRLEAVDLEAPDENWAKGPLMRFIVAPLPAASRPFHPAPAQPAPSAPSIPPPSPRTARREVQHESQPTQSPFSSRPGAPAAKPACEPDESLDIPAFLRGQHTAAPAKPRIGTKNAARNPVEKIRSLFSKKGPALIEEKIRLDLAAPQGVVLVGVWFDVAVAIRGLASAQLKVPGLERVISAIGSVFRPSGSELVQYLVEISAPDCDVAAPEYIFLLRPGVDSEPRFFQLRPKRAGSHSIIVTAYQTDQLQVAQARLVLEVTMQAVTPQRTRSVQGFMAVGAEKALASTGPVITELPSPPKEKQVALYDALKGYAFTLEDLKDLCFRLGVDWETLAGEEKAAKARSLVRHFTCRGAFEQLYAQVKLERPNLALA